MGDGIEGEAVVRAGAADEASSLLSRLNEIRELEELTSSLNDKLGERQLELEQNEQRVTDLSRRADESREHLQAAKVTHSTLEGKRALLERERDGLDSKIEAVGWEQGELRKRQEIAEAEAESLRESERTMAAELEATTTRRSEVDTSLAEAERQETDSAEMLAAD